MSELSRSDIGDCLVVPDHIIKLEAALRTAFPDCEIDQEPPEIDGHGWKLIVCWSGWNDMPIRQRIESAHVIADKILPAEHQWPYTALLTIAPADF